MNWRLINIDKRLQPASGTYSDWKPQIAEECFFQCVYCSIHESQFGGIINYHIDHFRPASKFSHLINDIRNLFYSCPICNRFKSNDWPSEPDLTKISYPDPSAIDYNCIFKMGDDFKLEGLHISSKYLIHRLYLNRSQLIFERRETFLRAKAFALIANIKMLIVELAIGDVNEAFALLSQIDTIKNNLLGLEEYRRRIRPFEPKDIQKR